MNLELLDPFGRQIPDRVDATLPLAPHLHFRQINHHLLATISPTSPPGKKSKKSGGGGGDEEHNNNRTKTNTNNVNSYASSVTGSGLSETGGTVAGVTKREFPEWRAAYHVSYNRRGTYVAVGYGSGAVAVHSTSSRTLAALYRSNAGGNNSESAAVTERVVGNGVTSVSWSRRSRTLLTGAAGDASVHVYDTTHPFGSEEAGLAIDDPNNEGGNDNTNSNTNERSSSNKGSSQQKKDDGEWLHAIRPIHLKRETHSTPFSDPIFDEETFVMVKKSLRLESVNVPMGTKIPQEVLDSFVLQPATDKEINPKVVDTLSDDEGPDSSDKKDKKRKKKKKRKRAEGRDRRLNKHPCVSFSFQGQKAVGGSLQINPRCPTGGLVALMDGSLMLFWFDPASSWMTRTEPKPEKDSAAGESESKTKPEGTNKEKSGEEKDSSPSKKKKKTAEVQKKYAVVVPLWSQTQTSKHFITCAAFDPQGERVYAATKDGTLLGFEVKLLFDFLAASSPNYTGHPPAAPVSGSKDSSVVASPIQGALPLVAPHFKISIPGGASAWHLIVSRNGKYLVLNSSDGALRLYSTEKCWGLRGVSQKSKSLTPQLEKPTWTFQDVVSKVKFVSCDLSGDGEFVVGGANGNDNRYELSIWNTSTGNLMDKLTGPAVQLYSVAWHPTRASLAVATSDGLVDLWGPKMNWTAFAPDFQALHKNIVYQEDDQDADDEKEDEKEEATPMEIDNDDKDVPSVSPSNASEPKKQETNSATTATTTTTTSGEGVDVLTMAPVPMFASDSENESETFAFETRVKNIIVSRVGKPKADKHDD